MYQFYYYLIWMGFYLFAVIMAASFFVCHWGGVVSGLGSRVSGVVDWGWDCCHLLSYG
jgi:hypothetical protein